MPADRRFDLSVVSGARGVLVVVAAAAMVAAVGFLVAVVMSAIFAGGG